MLLVAAVAWLHFVTLRNLRRDVPGHGRRPARSVARTEQFAGSLVARMVSSSLRRVHRPLLPYIWHMGGFAVALDAAVRRGWRCREPREIVTDGDGAPLAPRGRSVGATT